MPDPTLLDDLRRLARLQGDVHAARFRDGGASIASRALAALDAAEASVATLYEEDCWAKGCDHHGPLVAALATQTAADEYKQRVAAAAVEGERERLRAGLVVIPTCCVKGHIVRDEVSVLIDPSPSFPDDEAIRHVAQAAARDVAAWPEWKQHPTQVPRSQRPTALLDSHPSKETPEPTSDLGDDLPIAESGE
jgi:hypothetical protein